MLKLDVVEGFGNDNVEEFLLSNSCSLIYISRHYIELIAQETKSTPYWITVKNCVGLQAVLPLLVKHGVFGSVANSLAYYGSNGGVIANENAIEAKKTAIRGFLEFCSEIQVVASTIITNPLMNDNELYQDCLPYDCQDQRIGQLTFFPKSRNIDNLLSLFQESRLRDIRKAQRMGILVSVSQSQDAISFLHTIHDRNIRSVGGIPKRKEFFNYLSNLLPSKNWKIYLAKLNGQFIAGLLLLYYNNTVEYFTPCIVEEYRSSQALSLLIYQAMVDAMESGYYSWNWGGTWITQHGVYNFKKRWGTIDLTYYYFTRLYLSKLRQIKREVFLREYPNFFVLPFTAIEKK